MTRLAQAWLTRAPLMPSWAVSQATIFPVVRWLVASAGTCSRIRPGIQWRTENCIATGQSARVCRRRRLWRGLVLVRILGVQFNEMVEREDQQRDPHRRRRRGADLQKGVSRQANRRK